MCGERHWSFTGVSADSNRLFAFGDFDFRDTGFFEKLDQFFDLSYIQVSFPGSVNESCRSLTPLCGAEVSFSGDERQFVACDTEAGDRADGDVREEGRLSEVLTGRDV